MDTEYFRVYQQEPREYNAFSGRAIGMLVHLVFGSLLCLAQDDVLLKLYAEARAAEAAADYPAATQRYEKIVALRPDMAEAHANLGNLYYVQGRAERAAASFKKAIRLKPSLGAPHFFLGVLAFNARDFDRAQQYLNKAAGLDPYNPLVPLYLGYTLYAQSKHFEAVASLENVTTADGNNQDAWYHLSKSHGQLSKHYFEKLQKQYADSFYTYLARSHFYESGGNWEDARQELQRALGKRAGEKHLEQRMEWLHRRAQDESAAPPAGTDDPLEGSTKYLYSPPEGAQIRAAYEAERSRAAELHKQAADSPEILYALAEGHQSLSFLSSLWVLQTNPDSYRAHQLRGQLFEAANKMDEAIAEYQRALALKPELQTVHFAIGNLHWRRGRLEEALPELQQELKVDPNDPHAHYEIGDILFSQNKLVEAEQHFAKALQFAPDMQEAHLAIERIASASGDVGKAVFHLKKAAEIAPTDGTPHYRLWLLYRKLGKTAEAQKEREIFEKLKERGKAIP